jgi:integrase
VDWWLDKHCPIPSRDTERLRLQKHIRDSEIGSKFLRVAAVELPTFFDSLDAAKTVAKPGQRLLAPATLNKLRSILHAVFEAAKDAQPAKWAGDNPLRRVELRKVVKRAYDVLELDQIPRVLAALRSYQRGPAAVAVYLGLRKGEVFGLRKIDVDLEKRVLTPKHSFDRPTKNKKQEALPIPDELFPVLVYAVKNSPGRLVFPRADGSMYTREVDPHKWIRNAVAAAGFVNGYVHLCRRCKSKGQPYEEEYSDKDSRECPKCGMKLWARAIKKPIRFHDLRHSTATILLKKEVPLQHVQRLMRHSTPTVTANTYGHMVVEDLRGALNVMRSGPVVVPSKKKPA